MSSVEYVLYRKCSLQNVFSVECVLRRMCSAQASRRQLLQQQSASAATIANETKDQKRRFHSGVPLFSFCSCFLIKSLSPTPGVVLPDGALYLPSVTCYRQSIKPPPPPPPPLVNVSSTRVIDWWDASIGTNGLLRCLTSRSRVYRGRWWHLRPCIARHTTF